jgi:hypothetical protein
MSKHTDKILASELREWGAEPAFPTLESARNFQAAMAICGVHVRLVVMSGLWVAMLASLVIMLAMPAAMARGGSGHGGHGHMHHHADGSVTSY